MKKLLIVVPRLIGHGQERIAVKTAELLKGDYEIALVVFDGRDVDYSSPVPLIDLNLPASSGLAGKVKNVLLRARALRKIKGQRQIDFTLSFGRTANLVNVLSGRRGKILSNIRGFADIDSGKLLSMICRRSDAVICCAQAMREALLACHPKLSEKTVCLYNPLDTAQIQQLGGAPVTGYSFSPHTVVSQGRLEEVKNYPRLIKAFSLVRQELPDAQLLILGEGSERTRLEALICALGLQESVSMPGFQENPFAYLAKSSLYVLSSYSEGFPNALVEGMTFLPAVAVDCRTGPREIFSDGPCSRTCTGVEEADYGLLVPPATDRLWHDEITADDRILAEAMLRVLKDPALSQRLKTAAQTRAAEFSCERYRAKLIELLEKE